LNAVGESRLEGRFLARCDGDLRELGDHDATTLSVAKFRSKQ
jgi:hypothetical protein